MQGSAELAREYLAWVGPQANQYLSLVTLCLIGGFGPAMSVSSLYVNKYVCAMQVHYNLIFLQSSLKTSRIWKGPGLS